MLEMIAGVMVRFIVTAFFAGLLATWAKAESVSVASAPASPPHRPSPIMGEGVAGIACRALDLGPGGPAMHTLDDVRAGILARWPAAEVRSLEGVEAAVYADVFARAAGDAVAADAMLVMRFGARGADDEWGLAFQRGGCLTTAGTINDAGHHRALEAATASALAFELVWFGFPPVGDDL